MTVEPRPLRRDAERNRRRLLTAATEVFAESGFDVTMEEIAARAGVGIGTAYRRFANKDEVLTALFSELLAELTAIADRALHEEDPWQGIVAFLEGALGLEAGNRVLRELVLGSPHGSAYVAEVRREMHPRLEALVARAHSAGCLRPGIGATDLVIADLMVSAVSEPGLEPDGPNWRRFLPLVLDGLRGDNTDPLPGVPLRPDEVDAVVAGTSPSRSG